MLNVIEKLQALGNRSIRLSDEKKINELAIIFIQVMGISSQIFKECYSGSEYTVRFFTLIDPRYIKGDCCYDFVKGYENCNIPNNFVIVTNDQYKVVIITDRKQNHSFTISYKVFYDRDYLKGITDKVIRIKQSHDLGQP